MKKSIAVLTILAMAGAFWASVALAEGWRVGDFTDQAVLADSEKAVKTNGEKAKAKSKGTGPTAFRENASEKVSGEKTDLLPPTLYEEADRWNG